MSKPETKAKVTWNTQWWRHINTHTSHTYAVYMYAMYTKNFSSAQPLFFFPAHTHNYIIIIIIIIIVLACI